MKTVDDTDDDAAVDADDTHKYTLTHTTIRILLARLNLDKASIHMPLKSGNTHTHTYRRNMCCMYIIKDDNGNDDDDVSFRTLLLICICSALLCVTFTCVIYWSYKFAHNDKYAGGPKDGYEWIWRQWAR